jgi:hypothetical protein
LKILLLLLLLLPYCCCQLIETKGQMQHRLPEANPLFQKQFTVPMRSQHHACQINSRWMACAAAGFSLRVAGAPDK